MAISNFKCNLARIRSGLKSLINHHNIVVQTVNTINDDVQKLKANGGGGGGEIPTIVFTIGGYDEETGNATSITCTHNYEDVQSIYMSGNFFRSFMTDGGNSTPLSCVYGYHNTKEGLCFGLTTYVDGEYGFMGIVFYAKDGEMVGLN